jgi:hypothetical protein
MTRSSGSKTPNVPSASDDTRRAVDRFLEQAAANRPPVPRVTQRLIFALDATASRAPVWDLACELHTELFDAAASHGNLAIQLCFYRGQREFVASRWSTTPAALLDDMQCVTCKGGRTQLLRVLEHVVQESVHHPVRAFVFIGDAFEEDTERLTALAARLALHHVPAFVFHEGADPNAERAFATLARITRGAHVPFDAGSADALRALLGLVAAYAAGGQAALEHHARERPSTASRALLEQLKP